MFKVMSYPVDTRGTPGGGTPRLRVTSVAGSWFEGNAIKFNINRYDEPGGACSCTWTVSTPDGAADFTGAMTGTISFANAQEAVLLEIPTVARAGTQGSRTATLTLTAPVGCVIDPTASVATTVIQDVTGTLDTIMATAGFTSRVEGIDCVFTATREGGLTGSCTIQWDATSDGGAEDLTGTLTGTITWAAGEAGKNITISTVQRSGDQGTRAVRFVLKTPSNCTIKTGAGSASTNLTDYVPAASPLIGVTAARANVNEGSNAFFNIGRSRNMRGAVTVHWNIASSGGGVDWNGTHAGDVTIPDNSEGVTVSGLTAERSGDQGDRTLTCTLSAVSGGEIDGTQNPARCTLKDYTAPVGKWWKTQLGTLRCGRDWAGGPCYWNANWAPYQAQVAYITAFCGHHRGGGNTNISDWDKVFGGAVTTAPETVGSGTQFSWTAGPTTHFSSMIRGVTVNKAWAVFEFDMAPPSARVATGVGNGYRLSNATINKYNAATDNYDDELIQCGKRIRKRFEALGWDLNMFVGRMFHEMNGDWDYSITADTKIAYRNMLLRIYSKLREGADHYLHFAHCPVKKKVTTSDNSDLGAYDSWIPHIPTGNSGNVDVLAMSLHPDKGVDDAAGWNRTMNGSTAWYGLQTQIDYAELYDLALGAFEWSPKYENNTIANSIYEWAYEDFFYPQRARMLGDCVFHPNTLILSAADDQREQTVTGKANWRLGVAKFKELWAGTKPA
jgi:FlaG/FlaF family flagellin (archaellin)